MSKKTVTFVAYVRKVAHVVVEVPDGEELSPQQLRDIQDELEDVHYEDDPMYWEDSPDVDVREWSKEDGPATWIVDRDTVKEVTG